ncbi:hypothetical protein HXX76_015795 [Chlamydomonas incerta]|uniref:Uncharacterized protein n=1 Tax=Chlamydomonas incerta TaxID=51695 RepID=A0A835SLD1_CHLIN|nr:hypothetical protein HXX76_015795 [Chlamydomonas incerta]|eukprot:KAG2422775.1 hypothetical protein HXX76_015795 [Chlamydomonas incerta]
MLEGEGGEQSEEVVIPGMTSAAPPAEASSSSYGGGGGGGWQQQGSGNSQYAGRGRGGGGGVGSSGGRRGGRGGYGERRWDGGESREGGGAAAGGGAEGGAEGAPRGQYQSQYRGGGRGGGGGGGAYGGRGGYGGRGRGGGRYGAADGATDAAGTAAGGGAGAGGEERRTYKGPREALSADEVAQRAANNEAVRAAADWRALAVVLAERGGSLDGENIANMILKVARDGKPGPADAAEFEGLVAALYGWVAALAPGLRPKQVATCLYAVGRLELFNAELVEALAARSLALMGNFNSWEWSNMVWAFSRMSWSPGEAWLGQFVFWSEKRLGGFKPVELSNTISSLARLGHSPPATWLEAFAAAVAKQAPEFNTLETVNTLFGLASLGYSGGADPAAWLQPLLLGAKAPPAAGGGYGGGYGGRSVGGGGGGGGSALGAVESMRVADLTRATWALTQFDWRPSEEWLAAATRAFTSQLRYCQPSDLATISYSLAYLRAAPPPDALRLLAAQLSRAWDRLSGDELANVAMSLALWQYRPPSDRWLDELVLACRDKLSSGGCSPDGLSKVVSALPLLGQGYRLGQVVAQAQALLDGAAAAAAVSAEEASPEADAASGADTDTTAMSAA